MKKLFLSFAAIVAVLLLTAAAGSPALRKVVFKTSIECRNCVRKVVENVSFEKGVKDLKAELEDGSVTIIYNPAKTDTARLGGAIRKLGYAAEVVGDEAL